MRGWGAGRLPPAAAAGDLTMTLGSGSRCVGVMMTGPLGRPELFARARVALRPVWMSALAVSAETRTGSVSRHADRRGLPKSPFRNAC